MKCKYATILLMLTCILVGTIPDKVTAFQYGEEQANKELNVPVLFFSVEEFHHQLPALQKTINVDVEGQVIGDLLQKIAEEADLGIALNPDLPVLSREVETEINDITVAKALQKVLSETSYEASLTQNRELILTQKTSVKEPDDNVTFESNSSGELVQEDRVLTGVIFDSDTGEALPGVTIVVPGTTIGTTSDAAGEFELEVPSDAEVLQFSFVGYSTKEVEIDEQTNYEVELDPDIVGLDDIVVVGYGVQQRSQITGSISSVRMDDVRDFPSTNFESQIQGRVSGVQVTEPSGEPGSSPEIQVRGLGTITAGSDPLYVIDGMPIERNQELQGQVTTRANHFAVPSANPLATLNPGDIESIEILKDASAAAIYGSRGSNGVVMITTSRGTRDSETPPEVNFNASWGTQSVANRVDLMDAEEFIDFTIEARNNTYESKYGEPPPEPNTNEGREELDDAFIMIPESMVDWDGTDTDWQDEMLSAANIQNYSLSVAGGSEDFGYYLSGAYFNQGGIIDGSGFERYSFRLNLDSDVTDRFTVSANLNPSFTDHDRLPAGAPYFAQPPGIIYSGLVHSPTVQPRNEDGTPNQTDNHSHLGGSMTTTSNPLGIMEGFSDDIEQIRMLGSVSAEYDLTENLTARTMLGADINDVERNFYRANSFLFRNATEGDPLGQSNASRSTNWLTENTLTWNRETTAHDLTILAGFTAQKEVINQSQIVATDFPDDEVSTLNAGQVDEGFTLMEEWSLLSYLSRVNYSYLDRYILTGTVRADQSSRFGRDNQLGIFPSISAGWRISEEAFLRDNELLTTLMLKASYGSTGNFQIPNYGAIGLISSDNYVLGGSETSGVAPSTMSNQELSWETTRQFDVGLDIGLFDDRIFMTAEYYNTITEDLLLDVNVPSALGYTTALTNIGEVLNRGFELEVSSRNIVTDQFTWSTDFNYSMNHNEVLALGPEGDPILSSGGAGIRHITKVGEPIGSYWGYVVEGIYQNQEEIDNAPPDELAPNPQPGDFRFKDVNGDGVINEDDRTVTGNYQPDWIFGLTNSFSFRNFDLNVFLQGAIGIDVLNLTSRHLKNGEANFNSFAVFNDRWRSEDDPGNGDIPRADRQTGLHGGNNRPSSFQVEDASYIRLRNISLGYQLEDGWAGEMFPAARIYLTASNLYTWTDYLGYNPEVNNQAGTATVQGEDYGAYPLARTFTLGIDMSF